MSNAMRKAVHLLGIVVAMASGWLFAADMKPQTNGNDQLADELFTSLIPRLRIEFSPTALNDLRARPREYTKVTIREGSVVYSNVAVKLKGGRGSWRPVDARPGLTLNFDKFQPGQRFHGLDKLHLNNGAQDYTLMNEIVGAAVFRAAGIPAARATHARVMFNSEDMGVYVLKEGFDQNFLERHFARADGNLYDGGFLQDINSSLEKDSGSGPDDHSDLRKLYEAAMEPDLARRQELLAKQLDLDRFVTFAALERLVGHWDGYTANRNNYRLYFDPTSERFIFFPHGMDQLFGDPNASIMPRAPINFGGRFGGGFGRGGRGGRGGFGRGSILSDRVFDMPGPQRQYLVRVGELLDNVFTVEKLTAEVTRIEDRIRKQLLPIDSALASNLLNQASLLRSRLQLRVLSVRAQHQALLQQGGVTPGP